jgi:DNA polymerase V
MATETGFPSPARGYEAQAINLNELLVRNPPATFYMRMQGVQLVYRGILSGDLLVVDRSRPPAPGCLVVFRQDGDSLVFADGAGNGIRVCEETEIFGTVTGVIRKL